MYNLPVSIPDGYSPLLSNGDTVTIGQTIAQKTASDEEIINVTKELNISLGGAKKILKKIPGDKVEKGDILAIKKSVFGLNTEKLISRVEGTIIRYERDTGNLVIKSSYETLTENLVSPVAGVVTLCDNKQIVIGTDKDVFTGNKGFGKGGEGEIFVLEASLENDTDTPDNSNILYYLDSRAVGKIIVGGELSKDIIIKGAGLEAAGIICTSITDEDFEYIKEKKFEMPVIEVNTDIIEKLTNWKGKRAHIQGEANTIILLHT